MTEWLYIVETADKSDGDWFANAYYTDETKAQTDFALRRVDFITRLTEVKIRMRRHVLNEYDTAFEVEYDADESLVLDNPIIAGTGLREIICESDIEPVTDEELDNMFDDE